MRWQDWVGFSLGLWLAISPWVIGFSDEQAATANAAVVGIALAVVSLLEVGISEVADEWLNVAAGLWLIASPFVPGFGASAPAAINAVVVGILVTLSAAWAMSLDKEIARWWHEHVAGH
jgi:hypothetical protein